MSEPEPYQPCKSCPYRKDAPLGLWDPVEFQNLLAQDRNEFGGAVFNCHGEVKKAPAERALCAGWLLDQKKRGVPSIQLRLQLMRGGKALDQYERASGDGLELFTSIEAMCKANGVAKDGRIVRRLPAPKVARGCPMNTDPRVVHLTTLAERASGCKRCRLADTRERVVFARGNPFAELAFVGEAPGERENFAGEPFVGPSGEILDEFVDRMGFARDGVYVMNLVKCRPPLNRKPLPDEIAACRPFAEGQIGIVRPKVIVTLGATATHGLLRTKSPITRLRGLWQAYDGIPVMPTFHPAYLLRARSAKAVVWQDLQLVLEKLGREVLAR